MRRTTIFFMMVVVSSLAGTSISQMTEKHQKKEEVVRKESSHEMTGEEHERMQWLHSSMAELNVEMNKIFHAIISSNFSGLVQMSGTVRSVAEGLEGTRPHKNIKNIEQYDEFVRRLKVSCQEFERAVAGQKPLEITESFEKVVSTCVGCHIQFRD